MGYIAVIDNQRHEMWVEDIRQLGQTPEIIPGRVCSEFFEGIVSHFHNGGLPFDMTILDIGFDTEANGGIDLWERLTVTGYTAGMGKLCVFTNFANEQHILAFIDKNAEGRGCGSLATDVRRAKLKEFLKDIPPTRVRE